jgi:hypothetical protein
MLDEESQQEFTEEEWAEKQRILLDTTGSSAPLEGVSVEQEEQVADGPVTVRLSYEDGSDETMTAYTPQIVEDPGDPGGPKRLLTEEEISELEELPSFPSEPTASFTPEPTTSSPYGLSPEVEGQLRKAVEDYYEAVHRGDWAYTYDHLDSMTRAGFTRDEWFQKNEYFAGSDDLDLSAIYVEVNGSTIDPVVSVTVYRTLEDGTSIDRDTFFLWEDGGWQHRFGQEENDLYMPEASYEEFVEAQQ